MQPFFPHNLLRSWQCPFSNTLVMGSVFFFLGWQNFATWWNFTIKKYKSKKIQTSFHLVGVWKQMWDLGEKKNGQNVTA